MKNYIGSMTEKEYRAADGLSQSQLKHLAKSPSTFKYYVLDENETKETDAMIFGRAFHTYVLEPKLFRDKYYISEKLIRRGDKWKELQKKAGKKEILWDSDFAIICDMSARLESNYTAFNFLTDIQQEISIFWEDVDIQCKGRIDAIKHSGDKTALIDLKTACDIDPRQFIKQVFLSKYHMQAAYYMDGYHAITGKMPNMFLFVVWEKKPPYLCGLFYLSKESIELGRHEYKNLLSVYRQCKLKDEWRNGRYDESIIIGVPPWYLNKIGDTQ